MGLGVSWPVRCNKCKTMYVKTTLKKVVCPKCGSDQSERVSIEEFRKHKNTKKLAVLVLPALLILAVPSGLYAEMEHESEDEYVEFAANIEFMKGHFIQAIANKQQNELELAKAHAGHPVEELYDLIKVPLKQQNAELNYAFIEVLQQLPSKVDSLSATDFASEIATIEKMLDDALHAVVPESKMDENKFWIMVVIKLLKTAEVEYEEGVSEGQIKEMIEYQDSQGFVSCANAIFNDMAGKIDEHEAQKIEQFFTDLIKSMNNAEDPEQIESLIGGIVHEFEEIADIEHEMTVRLGDPRLVYVKNIRTLLDQTVEEYEGGEYDEAMSFAVKAYLDNYEFLKRDVDAQNEELNEDIERMLRDELLEKISNRVPASEVEALASEINTALDAVEIIVPEFPLGLTLMLTSVIGAIVALTRTRIGLGKC